MKNILKIGLVTALFAAAPLFGHAFDAGYIITDDEMTDAASMTQYEVYKFLQRKKSYLATYRPLGTHFASFAIVDAAQKYSINPKVILTMLQKEQSLVENSHPKAFNLDWALGYGMCDSCNRNTPGIGKFIGFNNQIYMAAKRIQEYMQTPTRFNYKPGHTHSIDGQDVFVTNRATAALYNYTPHLHGNKNFWRIWQRWFVKNIPNGSIVKLPDEPTVWLIWYGQKRAIKNMSVLKSRYDAAKIVEVSPIDLDKYEDGASIQFYPYSLFVTPQGDRYLLADEDTIRLIENDEVFRRLGYNPEELIEITEDDIQDFIIGEPITFGTMYPFGVIMKYNGKKYWAQDGLRYEIRDDYLLQQQLKGVTTRAATVTEFKRLTDAGPLLLADGALVKAQNSPKVYIIDEGLARPITSEAVFNALGYSWGSIATISDDFMNLHQLGKPIDEAYLNGYNKRK